ncbi:MAG: sulfite exporter TauE/SafE family protein [bacterium]
MFLVFAAGLIAGVVNTLAGGGSLLTLPLLIFMGLPGPIANGTNRVAIWVQCITAVVKFHQSGIHEHKLAFIFSIPTVIGAILGALVAVYMSDEVFRKVLAVVMIIIVALIVWNPKPKDIPPIQLKGPRFVAALLTFFLIGIYGGFIQAGVGYFFIAALTLLCGFNLIITTSLKVYIMAIYITFTVVIFIISDQVIWSYALVLSFGNGLGAWLGTHLAITRGEKWIRIFLVVSVIFMALKLSGVLPEF